MEHLVELLGCLGASLMAWVSWRKLKRGVEPKMSRLIIVLACMQLVGTLMGWVVVSWSACVAVNVVAVIALLSEFVWRKKLLGMSADHVGRSS